MELKYLHLIEDCEKPMLLKNLSKIIYSMFKLDIPVYECSYFEECSYTRSGFPQEIYMKFRRKSIEHQKKHEICFINNLDDYNEERFFDRMPKFLFIFFHELSHILTSDNLGEEKRKMYEWESKYSGIVDTNTLYRRFPYERLADNLSVALFENNKEMIYKILSGKRFRTSKEKRENNARIVREYKEKYIKPELFVLQ